jgi:hypothetical protein
LLFFGSRASLRRMWIPIAIFAASDVVLTAFVYRYSFSWDHFVTWVWYAGMVLLGSTLKKNAGWVRILTTVLAGSVSFFLLSNFAVWAAWDMYPHNLAGLLTCYDAGLPFFRRGVEGDLLFTSIMFAAPVLINAVAAKLQRSGDHTAAA